MCPCDGKNYQKVCEEVGVQGRQSCIRCGLWNWRRGSLFPYVGIGGQHYCWMTSFESNHYIVTIGRFHRSYDHTSIKAIGMDKWKNSRTKGGHHNTL
jgi:hypothetical protein